jgi:hypothetical protein
VELFGQKMATRANDESAIIGAVRKQVHKPLKTPEVRLGGILVLMGPWLVLSNVGAATSTG